nr:hypothetical protein [Cytophagales bacterium]
MKNDVSNEKNSGLIGYTGFVGGHLCQKKKFDKKFNTQNIKEIRGEAFDLVVCAAAPGSMFEANKFPEKDLEKVRSIIKTLESIKAKSFVLISSIAVLEDFAGGEDEDVTAFQTELAYGRNRRLLEDFVEKHFENSLIVRLPALFGSGLRKNFLFDLLNPVPSMLTGAKLQEACSVLDEPLSSRLKELYEWDRKSGMFKVNRTKLNADPKRSVLEQKMDEHGFSAIQFHNPETTYQYYDMKRLWQDITIALEAGLSHIHLVTEPLETARIYHHLKGKKMPETKASPHHEDMQTKHASVWGRSGHYLEDAEEVLDKLSGFFEAERSNQ